MTRLPASSEDAPLAELSNRGLSLSAALADALADVVPEPGAVRACGRGLGIDKNLAWRLVRLAEASDLAGVLSSRPGRRGWALAIAAFVMDHHQMVGMGIKGVDIALGRFHLSIRLGGHLLIKDLVAQALDRVDVLVRCGQTGPQAAKP